ncbi:MAG: hypothetical protein M3015_14335 [Bacteroidota bacterium]|nr:hypothetical protein [Bacteroidota bacterium]
MKNFVLFFLFAFFLQNVFAQTITYSEPESDDARNLDFEIIGKISGNILVYKNIRNRFAVSVYDNNMKLKQRVDLDFIPDKTLNVDFIAYPDFAYLIYQYQKKSILYCMAAKIDGEGNVLKEPVELDTTFISFFADNKIYSTVNSEDKSKIMIYKIQKKNDNFNFTTLLFNDSLRLMHKSRINTDYDEHRSALSDFFVTNDGTFVFTKGTKSNSRDFLESADLITKAPMGDIFQAKQLNFAGNYLDEIKLKVDNVNNHYLINSLYYGKKRGNVEGLYTAVWDKNSNDFISQNFAELKDSVRAEAKTDGALRYALNDFFIRDVILKKDGGFILAAEDHSTQSRGNPWNRYDYLYGYPYSYNSYYLYSPSSYWYSLRPRNYFNSNSQVRYYYDNIIILNLDDKGNLVWSNVIRKSQFDDNTDNYLSYNTIVTGGELHFIFNELERRNQLINDQSISPDGKITRYPPLHSLDRGYEFMPRYAKQVSSHQIIIPCTYRNYICFAKIDY